MGTRRFEAVGRGRGGGEACNLVRQRSASIGEDYAGHRLLQQAVFDRHLFRRSHEDTTRSIHHIGLDSGRDQPHDLIVQHLTIAGVIFIPNHEVHGQPLQSPIGMGLDHLTDQIDVGRVADLEQYDRQVPRNRIAPEARLSAAVFAQHGRFCPE